MSEGGVRHLRHFGAEVVTIVVGILLALGANAAYQYFADRADEREILAALRVEFEADIAEIDADQKHRDEKLAAIRLLLDTGAGAAGGSSPQALAAAVEATIGYRFYTASHPVLDDVLNTGRLDLIRSDALRQALMRFGAARSRVGVVEQLERDFVSSQMEPFVASRLDLASLSADSPVTKPAVIEAVSVLRTDPHFRSLLFLDERRTKSSHQFAELLRERVQEVQGALGPLVPGLHDRVAAGVARIVAEVRMDDPAPQHALELHADALEHDRSRRHGHLGGVSPEQFEAAHKPRRRGVH